MPSGVLGLRFCTLYAEEMSAARLLRLDRQRDEYTLYAEEMSAARLSEASLAI